MTRGSVAGPGLRSARQPVGKRIFLVSLTLLLAWLCALPWVLVDSDMPLTATPAAIVDPAPSE
ncbi:hypothetical protein J2X02_001150 [Pseudoxanthomonas japonensis]|uniref:hypothetical protein n=1 Tax=Pseudoxanthomonas TaxID=83618 RepID=UPI000A767224|nr:MULTISPECIES: hypothetical protein [Pseudoxanthomonas]MDR7068333.1 hypothetical protein [Pseudoxanthomonas japonensis]